MKVETTHVYRVESPGGYGPYCYTDDVDYDAAADAMALIDSGDDDHPITSCDPLLAPFFESDPGKYYSRPVDRLLGSSPPRHGFRSIQAARNWFHSGSLEGLIEAGYTLVEYELPIQAALHGTFQSIFDHEKALSRTVRQP